MYYSSGNYEAFATPKKPEGVDHKSAYIIGSGLAALTAACYLVRDGQMKGEHVHVFEKDGVVGRHELHGFLAFFAFQKAGGHQLFQNPGAGGGGAETFALGVLRHIFGTSSLHRRKQRVL